MAIVSLHLPKPLRRREAFPPRDHARRDRAIEQFDTGHYGESVREILAYLLPGRVVPDLAQEPLCLVQGTARVRVSIEDGTLHLRSTIAALAPDAQQTAALRYFLTRISSTGQLFQPRLRDGVIALEFGDPLPMMHPLKLLEALQRLALAASNADGWISDAFAVATPDREPPIALDDAEFAQALTIWSAHWQALDELTIESRRRRSVPLLDALGRFALNHAHYTLPLHGRLRAELRDASDDYNDRDGNPNKREGALARCIKEMRQTSADDLRRCLGHARYAINPLQDGTPSALASVLEGQRMEGTGELRAAGRYLEAALVLMSDYVMLLAHYTWSAEVEDALRAGLDAASGRPWREATELLWNHANATAKEFGADGEHDDAEAAASREEV